MAQQGILPPMTTTASASPASLSHTASEHEGISVRLPVVRANKTGSIPTLGIADLAANAPSTLQPPQGNAPRRAVTSRVRVLSFAAARTFLRPTNSTILGRLSQLVDSRSRNPQFHRQGLRASEDGHAIFCQHCFRELNPVDNSGLLKHINGKAHLRNRALQQDVANRQAENAAVLGRIAQAPVANDLTEDAFRLSILAWSLKEGISRSALESVSLLIDHPGRALGNIRQLFSYVPTIRLQQLDLVTSILGNPRSPRRYSIIFDGCSASSDLVAILARCVDADFNIHQCLIDFSNIAEPLNHENLAVHLFHVIDNCRLPWASLTGFICDNVGVNGAAVEHLLGPGNIKAVLAGCFSHMLDHVGEHFQYKELKQFRTDLNQIFSTSLKARSEWTRITSLALPPRACPTRWWSWFDTLAYCFSNWDAVCNFIDSCQMHGSECLERIRSQKANPVVWPLVYLQIACVYDAALPFVRATYILECDGPMILIAADVVDSLRCSIDGLTLAYTMQAIASFASQGIPPPDMTCEGEVEITAAWQTVAESVVTPAFAYFNARFFMDAGRSRLLCMYRVARACNPFLMATFQNAEAASQSVRALAVFHFIQHADIDGMLRELPVYLALSRTDCLPNLHWLKVNLSGDDWPWKAYTDAIITFWRHHYSRMPYWSGMVRSILTLHPSSAAAERVFSAYQRLYPLQRTRALEDHQQAALMLTFNESLRNFK